MTNIKLVIAGVLLVAAAAGAAAAQQFVARDPGVRGGPAGAGAPLDGLTASQQAFFDAGATEFQDTDGLAEGLGPRFNLDSCGGVTSSRRWVARARPRIRSSPWRPPSGPAIRSRRFSRSMAPSGRRVSNGTPTARRTAACTRSS